MSQPYPSEAAIQEFETVRRAVALMRERAAGVTRGAEWTGGHYWTTDHDPSDPTGDTPMQALLGGLPDADAKHYSPWSPALVQLVADGLDRLADRFALERDLYRRQLKGIEWDGAVALAHTYLGNDSGPSTAVPPTTQRTTAPSGWERS